jgi:HAD superfamily hydrolase (TIGR01549 family)
MMHNMQLRDYLAKNPKKYLIFDFDETIAMIDMDWSQYHARMAEIYKKFDSKRHHPAFYSYDGYNDFVREHGEEVMRLIKTANSQYEQEMGQGFIPNHKLIKFINQADGFRMFVYSSNSRTTVERGLIELSIKDRFEQIVSRDDVSYIKPDPEGFGLIYDPNIPKEDYLMIGNSSTDREMAEAVGIDFYLVDYF